MLIDTPGLVEDSIAENAGTPRDLLPRGKPPTDGETSMLNTNPSQSLIENRWDDSHAAGMSEPELLVYRSNLLGADKRVTNYGGGNTSAKVTESDPLTRKPVEVLWVKGSGGDLGSIKRDGFATLTMDKLNAMKGLYRGVALRGRDGGAPAARHLQPQSARRFDRHAAPCLPALRTCRPRASRMR